METSATPAQPTERPWHRRSELWLHEDEIRRLRGEGYSLRQILDHLSLGLSRSTLCRWLRRSAAAARATGTPAPAASPAAPPAAECAEAADDAAAEALLAVSNFAPPTGRSPR